MKDVKKEIKEQMKDTPDLCTRYYMLEDWYTALAYDAKAKNPKDDKFTDLDDKTESDVPFRAGRTYTVYDSYRLSQNHAKKASKYANKMIKQTLNQLVKQVYGPLRVFEKLSPKKARKKPNNLKKLCNLPPSPPPPPPSAPTWKNLVCPEGETKYNFEQLMYDVSLGAMSCTDVIKGAKPASLGNVEGAMEAGNEDSTSYCFLADGVTPSTIGIGSSSVKLAIKDICPKACGVCGAEFKEVVDAKNGVISSSKFVGDLVCFCGSHAAQCLKTDPQRVHENAVTLSRAHDLQEHLDNVPDDVEILTVTWGATRPVSVSFQPDGLRFLQLRVLSLQTLEGFRTVYLDQVTVPSLQDLTLQHKSRSCWVHLDLPQIRYVAASYAIAASMA